MKRKREMRILQINKFLYPKGGDAKVALATGELLSQNGHAVQYWGMEDDRNPSYILEEFFVKNIDYNKKLSFFEKIFTSFKFIYSFESKNKLEKALKKFRPDIVHLHNFAHQLTPAILYAIKKFNIPVVMTMHDYQLVCPTYLLLKNCKICEKCKNGHFGNCIKHNCTKNSKIKSILNTLEMFIHHKIMHISNLIDVFISPSVFLIEKYHDMGFEREIECIPHLVQMEKKITHELISERYILYFGRLSAEKGISLLIDSMKDIGCKLYLVGTGPQSRELKERVVKENIQNIDFLGYMNGDKLKKVIQKAQFTIVPSICYEVFGLTIIESFSLERPVIGAKIGGIPELVKDHQTGLTFEPGNADDLKEKITWMVDNPEKVEQMGKNARNFVEEKLNSEKHYVKLMKAYEKAIEINRKRK